MSNLDYEVSQVHASKGSVLPWLLLTVVVAMAAVGMVAFNTQKEQAMSAVDKYKQETDALKKRQSSMQEQLEDAQKQLTSMKAERDDMERQKMEATQKVTELTDQLKLTKAEATAGASRGGKHKAGHSRHRR
jgi:septal ring factor EnvC (AmiA/AmiB activator)